MNNLWRKSFMAGILSVSLTAGAVTPVFASAAPDGKTDAASLAGGNASFVVSAGDQVQTTKKKSPGKSEMTSEIEYTGYLSPDVLKSLPVATTVGNHDADNANYTYHFNTPNSSDLGSNGVVGGDYYFTYGNTLFMMLNTKDTNAAEHKQFM